MIPFISGMKTGKGKFVQLEVRRVVIFGGNDWKGYKGCFWVVGNVPFLDLSAGSMVCSAVAIYPTVPYDLCTSLTDYSGR